MQENHRGQVGGLKASRKAKPQMDGRSDEECRGAGNEKLENQDLGQRWLEATSRVGQEPAWVVAPGG